MWGIASVLWRLFSTVGVASVLWRLFSTVGDSISTAEAIQYCRVKFLIFLYLADIANQKLSAIYNFETKIALDFYCSDECEADQCALTPFPVPVSSFLKLSKWWGQVENTDVRISWILFSDF